MAGQDDEEEDDDDDDDDGSTIVMMLFLLLLLNDVCVCNVQVCCKRERLFSRCWLWLLWLLLLLFWFNRVCCCANRSARLWMALFSFSSPVCFLMMDDPTTLKCK